MKLVSTTAIVCVGVAAWLAILAVYDPPAPRAVPAKDDGQPNGFKLMNAACRDGRLGLPFKEVAYWNNALLKTIYDGCRQETAKDLSCYPFTVNKDGEAAGALNTLDDSRLAQAQQFLAAFCTTLSSASRGPIAPRTLMSIPDLISGRAPKRVGKNVPMATD